MRIRNSDRNSGQPPSLQMSSMIDVVFLLLIFFVMTFQITAIEGDLEIDASDGQASTLQGEPPRKQLFHVQLKAASDGSLQGIAFDHRNLDSIAQLSAVVQEISAGRAGDEYAVQLHVEQNLRYQHTMDAITAIRGKDADAPLIEDIRFVRGV